VPPAIGLPYVGKEQVGKSNMSGGNDERENTLNQLLQWTVLAPNVIVSSNQQ
jgi:hypothetical protein